MPRSHQAVQHYCVAPKFSSVFCCYIHRRRAIRQIRARGFLTPLFTDTVTRQRVASARRVSSERATRIERAAREAKGSYRRVSHMS